MPAAQGVVKWPSSAADADRAGRGVRIAAAGCRGRSHPPGACAGNRATTLRRCCASVAGAGGRRPHARGGAEPARAVGAHGYDAVRPRPPLFALADHASVARDLVHADRLGRCALRAADRPPLVSALGVGMGAHRARRCRRHSRACISSKQPSRSIAPSRRARRNWCRRSTRCSLPRRAARPAPGDPAWSSPCAKPSRRFGPEDVRGSIAARPRPLRRVVAFARP